MGIVAIMTQLEKRTPNFGPKGAWHLKSDLKEGLLLPTLMEPCGSGSGGRGVVGFNDAYSSYLPNQRQLAHFLHSMRVQPSPDISDPAPACPLK